MANEANQDRMEVTELSATMDFEWLSMTQKFDKIQPLNVITKKTTICDGLPAFYR